MQVHLGDWPKLRFKLGGPEASEMHPDVVINKLNPLFVKTLMETGCMCLELDIYI